MAKYYFYSLILALIGIGACNENSPEPLDRSALISGTDAFGKTWGISGIEVPLGTVTPKSCVADNLITYYPNGNYEVITGRDKCDPSEAPALIGTREMNADETRLFVQIEDSTQAWDIERLTASNQEISSLFPDGTRIYSLVAQ